MVNMRHGSKGPCAATRARACLAGMLLCSALTWADMVTLESGETLSGSVLRVEDGVLVFRTSMAGQIMAPMDTLKALSCDTSLMLTLDDGTALYGRLIQQDGRGLFAPLDRTGPKPITLARISSALLIPNTPSDTPMSRETLQEWRTSVQSGVLIRDIRPGEAESVRRISAERDWADAAVSSELLTEQTRTGEAPGLLRGRVSATGDIDAPTAPYAELEAERDLPRALEMRTGLSLGLLGRILETPHQQLAAAAGLGMTHETWTEEGPWRAAAARDASGSEPHMQIGLRYQRAFIGKSELSSRLSFYPALPGGREWRARSEAALTLPVIPSKLLLRLNVLLDYDNPPGLAAPQDWKTEFGASIGIRF